MFLLSFFFFATPLLFGQSEKNALPKLLPPYGQMPPTFWEQHGTAVLAGSFIFLALAAVVVWKILKPKPRPVLPPGVVARAALAKLQRQPENGKVLSEVSQVLRHYMSAAFEFPSGELTTAEFSAMLAGNEKISAELARTISSFLRECDERKFSPANPPAPLNAATRALEILAFAEREMHRQEACAAKE